MKLPLALALSLVLVPLAPTPAAPPVGTSAFARALEAAERSLANSDLPKARAMIERALERDAKSTRAWALRARWAEAAKDQDELVFALHTQLRLAVAQKEPKAEVAALRERLIGLDPVASDLLGMNARFIKELEPVANSYEKEGRPHSAIRVHKQILALDPEHAPSLEAIERISSLPDPSLAADAKAKDLLADVSDEWIRAHDAEHATWETRAKLERENYTTYTNAGYEVLVRAAEAMEQMNAFYREFFQYATEEEGGSVPRIDLNIFAKRDEYLKLGIGPPVEWSGGHFTGSAVETYVEGNGFDGMTGTLFHEAAHQFVSLATNAAGWLNEGIASFFEGCRILPNGTVLMNMPAASRLFDLADRMDKGWMASASDGIDPSEPSKSNPEKAPTFRIVLENEYQWGPPWYAPTWGVVYFLYNYQDQVDGHFVYRPSFREYVDKSGGRIGKGAIKTFEEIVLANPAPPIKGVERKNAPAVVLPKTVDELNELWRKWILELRDEQIGKSEKQRPYLHWARCALLAKDAKAAQEHFEKGLVATPGDIELLTEFADFVADRKNTDRACKLALEALRVIEARQPVDEAALRTVERLIAKWDPKRATLERVQHEIESTARSIVERYRDAKLHLMVMDVGLRLGRDLGIHELFDLYAAAAKESGKTLQLWQLAYNEENLQGWDSADKTFTAAGPFLESSFKEYSATAFDYQVLALDKFAAGDFSLEADVYAQRGEVNFCGLVFGRKNASNFQALVYFPGKPRQDDSALAASAFIDVASFLGGGSNKTWRHNAVDTSIAPADASTSGAWHKLRIDVSGTFVDAWYDGELMATQEFPNTDVVRGTFGLLTGVGKARFKEVRFLARDPRDPAGAIERGVRMERIKQAGGGAVGGSWLGQVPPWPKVGRWAQGERTSWQEKGPVPQLLVLWSIQQNDIVAIDRWLVNLVERYAASGLEVVSVASPNDDEALAAYLKEHPFPGSVAVDFREGPGIGDTNKMFFTMRFNLPRLLLLDIDHTVAWEGDPGFSAAEPWRAGVDSFLDLPLQEMLDKRKLAKLKPWLDKWNRGAADALHAGAFESVYPLLVEAREFDGDVMPQVRDAHGKLAAFEDAVAHLADAGALFAEQGREPSMKLLLAWAKAAGKEPDKRALAALKPITAAPSIEHWERALKQVEGFSARIAKDPALVSELLAKLDKLEGTFAVELAERIRAAGSDAAALAQVFAAAPKMPVEWLAQSYFNW